MDILEAGLALIAAGAMVFVGALVIVGVSSINIALHQRHNNVL